MKRLVTLYITIFLLSIHGISFAQNVQSTNQQLAAYAEKFPSEKLYVHTDRNFYLAGEMIWFKLYQVNANDLSVGTISNIAYVELLNENGMAVLQAKIELNKGTGAGSWIIPVTVSSGRYQLRAYTSWMKNFPSHTFFYSTITVINTQMVLPTSTPEPNPVYTLNFFPESGHLVNGLPTKLAFKATDHAGRGINFSGKIMDETGNTLHQFSAYHLGMGSISFTPDINKKYWVAAFTPEGTELIAKLPEIKTVGHQLNLLENDATALKLKVQCNDPAQPLAYLLIHNSQNIFVQQQIVLQNGVAELSVEKTKLGPGVLTITVFNQQQLPVCERLVMGEKPAALDIKITMNSSLLDKRTKTAVYLETANAAETLVESNLSLSVYRVDELQQEDGNDIYTEFWLRSELKGHIEQPAYYLTSNTLKAKISLDNLLLTQGWRKFNWDHILSGKAPSPVHMPEKDGHIVNGKVTNRLTGAPASSVMCYLSVVSTIPQIYTAISNEKGEVRFFTKYFYTPGEVILQAEGFNNDEYDLEIRDAYLPGYKTPFDGTALVTSNQHKALEQNNLARQVQQIYTGNKFHLYEANITDTTPFFGVPDVTYKTDNYVKFTTMEEVLREYIPEVNVRKQSGNFKLFVVDIYNKRIFRNDPFILIDGLPFFDIDRVMQFDPLKLRELGVLHQRYYYGPLQFDGIISMKTYKGDLGGFALDSNTLVVNYAGLQQNREFYNPVYETAEQLASPVADYRNLLYWAPLVKTTDGKNMQQFYTSDIPGTYKIVVEGISTNGLAGKSVYTFKIKEE